MKLLFMIVFLILLVGCNKTRYQWGDYESHLYSHYRNPAEKTEYLEGLKDIIEDAEVSNEKIPPGIYAEYGYALLDGGKPLDAILLFNKEAALWPESKILMRKMIQSAEKSTKTVTIAPVIPEQTK